MSWTFWREIFDIFKTEVKTPFKWIWIVYRLCVLGAVARLLLTEKPKCNLAIWAKIKVWSSGGVYSTERNDGLNHGTERFLKLKLATYNC